MVGMVQSQLLGADALVGLDRRHVDVAAVELSAVSVLASATAAGLARRFGPDHLARLETAAAALIRGEPHPCAGDAGIRQRIWPSPGRISTM